MRYLKGFQKFNEVAEAQIEAQTNLSFEEIYSKYWDKMLRRVGYKYTKDKSTAEDYTQEGFMKVMKNLDKYDGSGSLEGWITRVIRNTIIDKIRSNKNKDVFNNETDWERMDMTEEPEEELSHSSEEIKKAVDQLSPQYKEVFTRYFFKNMTHKEIADELGIAEGTSKSNLSKAKAKIKEILGPQFTD